MSVGKTTRTQQLSRRHDPDAGAGQGTPGKRALTDGIRMKPATGARVVDEGTACEGEHIPEGADCYLAKEDRNRLISILGIVVVTAMGNYRDAIQNIRLDQKIGKNTSSWGFWAEFLFYSLTGPLIGAALAGLKGVRAAAMAAKDSNAFWRTQGISVEDAGGFAQAMTKVRDEDIAAVLQNASRGLRTELKNGAHGASGDDGALILLKILQSRVKELSDTIVIEAPVLLDDAGLAALMRGYRDPVAHDVAAYEASINDALARFNDQNLDRLGDAITGGGKVRPVELVAWGHRRTAVLAEHGTGKTGTGVSEGGKGREDVYDDGTDYLMSLVDDDLAPLTHELYAGDHEIIDVTEGALPFRVTGTAPVAQFEAWRAASKSKPIPTIKTIDPASAAAGNYSDWLGGLL